MSDHGETPEAPNEENIEEEITETPPQKEEHTEEPQQEQENKDKDAEAVGDEIPPKHETGDDLKTPGNVETVVETEEVNIDESHATDLIETEKKEEENIPVASVSFADVGLKDIEDEEFKPKSVTSAMSYDTVTTVDGDTKARAALGSIISIRRGSAAGGEYYDRHKAPKYMNSYKLAPDKPFHVERVEKFMREILTEALENATYDADKTPKQAKWASSAMRAKLKEQEYDRCKFICIVTMGEKRSQDVHSIFRFLWDLERDKFAQVVHENMSVFAVAVCFGIYYE